MKQTNLLSCRLNAKVGTMLKPLGFIFTALLTIIVLGSQSANAQTMVEVGELKSDEAIQLVRAEIDFLEQEVKTPASGVSTDKNGQLIAFYNMVIRHFRNGGDFAQGLRNLAVLNSPTNGTANPADLEVAGSNTDVILDYDGANYKEYNVKIGQLDLTDEEDSDLTSIFNYLRTLKNQ